MASSHTRACARAHTHSRPGFERLKKAIHTCAAVQAGVGSRAAASWTAQPAAGAGAADPVLPAGAVAVAGAGGHQAGAAGDRGSDASAGPLLPKLHALREREGARGTEEEGRRKGGDGRALQVSPLARGVVSGGSYARGS